jgi:hypothetical protein
MIAGTPMLQLLLLAYTGSLQAYNLCGMVTAGGACWYSEPVFIKPAEPNLNTNVTQK